VPVVSALGRDAALAQLLERIAQLRLPARIAVDGVDAAGKTTLAGELGERLPSATRISADDFLRPVEDRHRQGRESARGFYDDSFDHERLRGAVLAASVAGGTARFPQTPSTGPLHGRALRAGFVIVDGVFLFRPELNDLWDFRIFVHVELEEAIRRGVERDAGRHGSREEAERLYRTRYAPGQEIYLESVRPRELADVVVDNTDLERPRVSPGAGDGRP
jgi:uridine kinase